MTNLSPPQPAVIFHPTCWRSNSPLLALRPSSIPAGSQTLFTPSSDNSLHSQQWQLSALPAVTTLCTPSSDISLHSLQWQLSTLPAVTTVYIPSKDNSLHSQQWQLSELPVVTHLCTPNSDNSLHSQQWQLSALLAVTTLWTPISDKSQNSQQWQLSKLRAVTALCTPSSDNSLHSQTWQLSALPAVTTLYNTSRDIYLHSQQWQFSELPAVIFFRLLSRNCVLTVIVLIVPQSLSKVSVTNSQCCGAFFGWLQFRPSGSGYIRPPGGDSTLSLLTLPAIPQNSLLASFTTSPLSLGEVSSLITVPFRSS